MASHQAEQEEAATLLEALYRVGGQHGEEVLAPAEDLQAGSSHSHSSGSHGSGQSSQSSHSSEGESSSTSNDDDETVTLDSHSKLTLMDDSTAQTGDHVTSLLQIVHHAPLKFQEEEQLPRRWSESAELDEEILAAYNEAAMTENELDNKVFSVSFGGGRRGRGKSPAGSVRTVHSDDNLLLMDDDDHESDDSSGDNVEEMNNEDHDNNKKHGKKKNKKKKKKKKDYAPLQTDQDEEESTLEHSTRNGGAKSVKSTRSSLSGVSDATPTMDNRTTLLYEYSEEDAERKYGRRLSQMTNLRGSLTSLKDNLTEKANLLGDILKHSSGEGNNNNLSDAASSAIAKDDPPEERENVLPNHHHGMPSVKRPVLKKPNSSDSHEYLMKGAPVFSLPGNLNRGNRPRNRRGTVESESMWTAFTNMRRASNESSSGFSFWTHGTDGNETHVSGSTNAITTRRRRRSDESNHSESPMLQQKYRDDPNQQQQKYRDDPNPRADGVHYFADADEENPRQCRNSNNGLHNEEDDNNSDHSSEDDKNNNEDPEEESWIGSKGSKTQGSLFPNNHNNHSYGRRNSMTPFIDEDGNAHFLQSERTGQFYRPGRRTLKRCLGGILFAIIVTALSSALIGSITQNNNKAYEEKQDESSNHKVGTYIPIPPTDPESIQQAIDTISQQNSQYYTKQDLFNMAKSVNEHCHSEQLKSALGRWECQQICHDHLCCFDIDDDDDENDESYNCRNDESKLCSIFALCEVLVLEDVVIPTSSSSGSLGSAGGASKESSAVSGFAGGTTIYDGISSSNGNEDKATSSTSVHLGGQGQITTYNNNQANNIPKEEMIQQQVIEEDNMGWKEIRRKYINVYCEPSNVKSKEGRKQCEKVCEHHFCCFDTTTTGGGTNNCRDDKSMTCDVYEACGVLVDGNLLEDDSVVMDPAILHTEEEVPPGKDDLPAYIPPDMMGEMLEMSQEEEMLDPTLYGEVSPEDLSSATNPDDTTQQYSNQELLEMKADVKQRCSDYHTPTGRLHCEKACKFHFCCFDSVDNGGCRDNAFKLCDIYDVCKVLLGTSSIWVEDTTVVVNKEDEVGAAQQVVVMITPEEEHENDEDEDNLSDYSIVVKDEVPVEEDVVDEENGKEEEQTITASPAGTSRPTPKPNTPQPTPSPTSKATPKPTLQPTSEPTSPPIPVPKPAHQTTLSKPLPKPPPIRCIPSGDDDLHTEVYTDDWNDDRYDRCKRWEKKTGMTVEEYWDLQGIDSELEKNILENMLIMDNANINKEDATMKEENDDQSLTPLDFSPLQDKLDDDLFGKDDLLLMEEEAEEFLDELDDEIFAEDEDELGQDIQVGDTTSEDEYESSGFVNRLRGLLL